MFPAPVNPSDSSTHVDAISGRLHSPPGGCVWMSGCMYSSGVWVKRKENEEKEREERRSLVPVLNQPSWVKDSLVASGLFQYSLKTDGPRTRSSPSLPSKPGQTWNISIDGNQEIKINRSKDLSILFVCSSYKLPESLCDCPLQLLYWLCYSWQFELQHWEAATQLPLSNRNTHTQT